MSFVPQPCAVEDTATESTVAVSNFPESQTVDGTVEITNDIGNPIPVSGSLAIEEPVTVDGSVSVTNFPATQPISGTVEIANDVGNPIPVSGALTDAELRASPISTNVLNDTAINKFESELRTTRVFEIFNSGDNIIIVPAIGKKLRVYWVGYSSSELNTGETLALLRFGSNPNVYGWYLGNPGAFSHWEPITGNTDEALIVSLSSSQTVQVNLTYLEI